MTHTHLTRWIELADERHFCETAMLDRLPRLNEPRHCPLGSVLFGLPSRIRDSLGHRMEGTRGR